MRERNRSFAALPPLPELKPLLGGALLRHVSVFCQQEIAQAAPLPGDRSDREYAATCSSASSSEPGSSVAACIAQDFHQLLRQPGWSETTTVLFRAPPDGFAAVALPACRGPAANRPTGRSSTRPHWSRLSSMSAIRFSQSPRLVARSCNRARSASESTGSPPSRASVRRAAVLYSGCGLSVGVRDPPSRESRGVS